MTSFGANIGGMTWCKGVLYGRDVDGSSSKVMPLMRICAAECFLMAFSHCNVQFDIVSHGLWTSQADRNLACSRYYAQRSGKNNIYCEARSAIRSLMCWLSIALVNLLIFTCIVQRWDRCAFLAQDFCARDPPSWLGASIFRRHGLDEKANDAEDEKFRQTKCSQKASLLGKEDEKAREWSQKASRFEKHDEKASHRKCSQKASRLEKQDRKCSCSRFEKQDCLEDLANRVRRRWRRSSIQVEIAWTLD